MKKALVITLIIYAGVFKAQIYSLTQFTQEDGLPSAYIYDITQDKRGFLTVATGEGLSYYAGIKFATYDTSNGLGDNLISCLAKSDNGYIVAGHQRRGISFQVGQAFKNCVATTNLEELVSCILYSKDVVFFGTKTGRLGIYKNEKLKWLKLEGATFVNKILYVNDALFIATDNGIYTFIQERSAQIIPVTEGIHFTSLCQYWNGRLLAGSESGEVYVYAVKDKGITLEQLSVSQLCKNIPVKSIITTMGNRIMAGSWGKGIYTAEIENSSSLLINKKNISVENGLNSLFVNVLYKDFNDNIWIGTFGGGLYKFNNNHFRVYDKHSGLYSDRVKSVLATSDKVLAGLENGFQVLYSNKMDSMVVYNRKHKFIDDQVTSIAKADDEHFFIGTETSGLFFFDAKTNTVIDFFRKTGVKLPVKRINHVAVAKDSVIYISTLDGLFIYEFKRKKLKKLCTDQGLPHNNILSTFLDSEGRLWFVAPKSVPGLIQNDSIILFKDIPEFSSYNTTSVCEGRRGTIYITTNGDGIYKYNKGTFTRYTTADGLVSDYVLNAAYDRNKEVIICSHQNGFSVFDIPKNKIRAVSSKSNLNTFESSANTISVDNSIVYFGTEQGLGVYLINEEKTNCQPPKNSILRVLVNKTVYSAEDSVINLPYSSYDLQFDYIGIELTYPGEVRYTYKLEGIEKKFKTTSERHLEYNKIGEGEYTFILYSTNYLGIRNTLPLKVKIRVAQPLYKKWWFLSLILITLVLLVYFIVKFQTKKLVKQKNLLQNMVKERTKEIIKINEVLESKNFNITSSIDYALRIQNVLLPERNEIGKSLDTFIFHKPKDVVSGDFYWYYITENYTYIAAVDCTGHGVPGAFMSIIGTFYLDQIVSETEEPMPSYIVTELDKRIVKSLRQYGRKDGVPDGMDVALCRVDKKKSELIFCGAHRPFYFISGGEFLEFKSNRFSVGGFSGNHKKEFIDEITSYQKGDMFYLFSDGYGDQFGGEGHKRFSTKEMKRLFLGIYGLDTQAQLKEVHQTFTDWITYHEQTDDILVIGVKL